MPQPVEITSSIFMVGSGELSGGGDCCVYAISLGNGKFCLIDAGTSNANQVIQNIRKITQDEVEIIDLILTHAHYDHAGATHQLKKKFPEMKIHAHELDVPAIEGERGTERITAASWYGQTYRPVKVDVSIAKEKEKVVLGSRELLCLHTPGHTEGSISVLVEDDGKKILFGQDIHGPFLAEFKSNIQDWANSMQKLLDLKADILCEGHFGVYKGKDRVERFITNHLRQNGF
ncbi:MAG: MBL fold metallo-hydrolase [Candidatus Hodarchaeota archaeon]